MEHVGSGFLNDHPGLAVHASENRCQSIAVVKKAEGAALVTRWCQIIGRGPTKPFSALLRTWLLRLTTSRRADVILFVRLRHRLQWKSLSVPHGPKHIIEFGIDDAKGGGSRMSVI